MIKNPRDLATWARLVPMAVGLVLACFGTWPGVGAFAVGAAFYAFGQWLGRPDPVVEELRELRVATEAEIKTLKERLARVANKAGVTF